MANKLKIEIDFKETDYGKSEEEILLEILGLHGYFDQFGKWHDAEE